jgi:MoaA/NifB/PqqE/SkfB family radical SAM enzyme
MEDKEKIHSEPFLSHVALNIINRCQQRCVFCFEGKRENKKELPFEDVIRLIEDASRKVSMIVFMGGEALLRKDIFDIINFTKSLGLKVNIFTNGQVFSDRSIVEKLFETKIETLHFSVNFWDRESFTRITRTKSANWDRLMKGLSNINEMFRMPEYRDFQVDFNVVVFREMADHLKDFMFLLTEHLPDWKPRFTFKQILFFPCPEGMNQSILWRAPFQKLRDAFSAIPLSGIHYEKIIFQGFPLCVLPGMEHLSIDLRQMVENYKIYFNFSDQEKVSYMTDISVNPLDDTYSFICRDCSYVAICPGTYTRFQWKTFNPLPDDTPVPSLSNPEDVIIRFDIDRNSAVNFIAQREKMLRERQITNEGQLQSDIDPEINIFIEKLKISAASKIDGTGYRILRISDISGEKMGQIRIELSKGEKSLVLQILPLEASEDYFLSMKKFGLRYSKDTPLNTEEKVKIARIFLETAEDIILLEPKWSKAL